MPVLNIKLPQWLASACAVIALAAWVLGFKHLLPEYADWESAAVLFFGALSIGTFSVSPSISNRINIGSVAKLPAAVLQVKKAVDSIPPPPKAGTP
jgi:hypothetical protein